MRRPRLALEARQYGAVAQLGERLDRTQEARGSSPLSSTREVPASLPLGVTGNTPDSGSGESWFDPRRGNLQGPARQRRAARQTGLRSVSGVLCYNGGVMGLIATLVIGLIIGSIAKLLVPGRDPGGWIVTILLGIAGALVGTWLGRMLGIYQSGQSAGWIASII